MKYTKEHLEELRKMIEPINIAAAEVCQNILDSGDMARVKECIDTLYASYHVGAWTTLDQHALYREFHEALAAKIAQSKQKGGQ